MTSKNILKFTKFMIMCVAILSNTYVYGGTLYDDNEFGQSWLTPGDWDDDLAPDHCKDYIVDGTNPSAGLLRTPTGSSQVFQGRSLTIKNGGGIWIKVADFGSATVDSLFFDNGKLVTATTAISNSSVTWNGNLTVKSGGLSFVGNPGPLVVQANLLGSGPITHNDADRDTTLNAGNWGGNLNLGGGTLRFGYDVIYGRDFVHTGGSFDINGRNHQFDSLTVSGSPIAPGTYTAAQLGAGFIGGGTVEVYESSILSEIIMLESDVAALPDSTDAEGVKRAVLELALERARNALDVRLEIEAQALVDNVNAALATGASVFAQRNPSAANLAVLRPLLTSTNNPYLDDMELGALADIAVAGDVWPRAVDGHLVFSGIRATYGTRSAMELTREYFWLFAHNQSPMKSDPELLKRILRRAHAFIDMLELDPTHQSIDPSWYDQFATSAGFSSIFEIKELHPGLLLPSERTKWDSVIDAVSIQMGSWNLLHPNHKIWNYNIETARMLGILNVALYKNDQSRIDKVIDHADFVMALMREDGAVPYHGEGKPSLNYHNELISLWVKMYEQLDYQPFEDAIAASQWKGPTMGKTDEFWTSPFYKTARWNYQKGTEAGPEAVAALSENPYVTWLTERDRLPQFDFPGIRLEGRDDVAWYRDDLPQKALPDNYTIPDRNQGGPRAWYGNFNYAGAFTPNGETSYGRQTEGRETLMGAMTVDNDGRLNSVLSFVTPRVLMTPLPAPNACASSNETDWGKMTTDEVAATTITRNYSVSSSIHGIRSIIGTAGIGTVSDWEGRQLWIGLPDRIIGLVSTVPTINNAGAHELAGVLRFVSGGTAGAMVTKVLDEIVPDQHYRYGELDIIVHDSTYNYVRGENDPLAYRKEEYPAYELAFSDRVNENDRALESYPQSSEFRFVVEVRPTSASPTELSNVSVLGNQQLIGLEAVGVTRSFQVWLNAGSSNVQATIDRSRLPAGIDSIALSDGPLGRPVFDGTVPSSVTLEPGQFASVVVSGDPYDHGNGWQSFESMVTGNDTPDVTFTELTDDNQVGQSWQTGGDWSNGVPAQPGLNYLVDGVDVNKDRMRTPTNVSSPVFPGDSLTLTNGGGILIKSAAVWEVSIANLFSDQGELVSANTNSTVTWKGSITVKSGGLSFNGNPGVLVVDATLSGVGPISHLDADRDTTLNTGTWGGALNLGGGTLRFGYDVTGGDFVHSGGTFDINGRAHTFDTLTVGSIPISAGTYTAAQLGGGFTGSGTIEVL